MSFIKGKEVKDVDKPNRDPGLTVGYDPNDRLSLPQELKTFLKGQEMDYRFLNSAEFRASGGYHRSQWQPFDAKQPGAPKVQGVTAEGVIQRGDLVLGVRPKALSAKYKEALMKRNQLYANFNKTKAKEMRAEVIRRGLSEHVAVDDRDEGSDD